MAVGSIPMVNGGAGAGGADVPSSSGLKTAAVGKGGKGKEHEPPMQQRRISVRIQALQMATQEREARCNAELGRDKGKRPVETVAPAAASKGSKRGRASCSRDQSVGEGNDVSEELKKKMKMKMKMKQSVGDGEDVSVDLGNATDTDTCSAEVKETIRVYTKHYLHFVQEEEKRCVKAKAIRDALKKSNEPVPPEALKITMSRADLKAITRMKENNEILFPEKRIGDIPGVHVGHQFHSRAEMVAVGFHNHWLNGIDFISQSCSNVHSSSSGYKFPVAVSVVISGMYEDDVDQAEEVVYTGQGGNDLNGGKRQFQDQKLERGNLALQNCVKQGVPVRVTRGLRTGKGKNSPKVYIYDGLYMVTEDWLEKGISGFTVYKFRLKRLQGQTELRTQQVYFTNGRAPQSVTQIRGLVCEDITGGQEKIPIPATNLVDDPPVPPTGFTYLKSLRLAKNVKLPPLTAAGCKCKGNCADSPTCECAMRNGGDFAYVSKEGGRLVAAKDVVFECGPNCGCGPHCLNRTSQNGIKYRLEVFRTAKKGWAVRSWDYIPSGAPICEYTGVLARTEDIDRVEENSYILEIDCLQTIKEIGVRERRSQNAAAAVPANLLDDQGSDNGPEFCIDAASTGNIARFINHCCEPNLFVQCVLSTHHDLKLAKVMLFAADNIAPLQELTYDYGYELDSVMGPDGKIVQMPCYCGAPNCRKRLY